MHGEYRILALFGEAFTFLMILILLMNIEQRKMKRSNDKRRAILLLASWYLTVYIVLIAIEHFAIPPVAEYVALAIGILMLYIFRKYYFPFRRKCTKCGKKLDYKQWIGCDENLCIDCYYEKYPEEKPEEKKPGKVESEDEMRRNNAGKEKVSEIDWDNWSGEERCTLMYVIDKENGKVLLIKKKRGMGKGLLNGPGGHIELEETKYEAAVRETKEETGLDVKKEDIVELGTLRFQFKDGLTMTGYVFITYSWSGSLMEETNETIPFWQDISSLDYSKMWEDDEMWLPYALSGRKIEGYFIFDGETLIDGKVEFPEDDE